MPQLRWKRSRHRRYRRRLTGRVAHPACPHRPTALRLSQNRYKGTWQWTTRSLVSAWASSPSRSARPNCWVRRIARALEADDHEDLIRSFSARELVAGAGLLVAPADAANVWNRVAGDAMDLAALVPPPATHRATRRCGRHSRSPPARRCWTSGPHGGSIGLPAARFRLWREPARRTVAVVTVEFTAPGNGRGADWSKEGGGERNADGRGHVSAHLSFASRT
jgi:hypothetical protein